MLTRVRGVGLTHHVCALQHDGQVRAIAPRSGGRRRLPRRRSERRARVHAHAHAEPVQCEHIICRSCVDVPRHD
jgi:hypothetical protein